MKILIVGAGPIGCYTARLLKEKGDFEFKIIEEHAELGRPVHCAGLVSQDVFMHMQIQTDSQVRINDINGAEFFFNGDSFIVRRKNVALVIDREKFDSALGQGLDIDFNTRFMGIEKEGKGYLVETDRGEYYADIVIGADGANSALRKAAGFREDIQQFRGVQFRIKYNNPHKDLVQVYLKRPFFAWIIPETKEIARAGIISDNPYHDLMEFLKGIKFNGEILEKFAGIVSLGNCQTQDGNIVLVGDAACQVKPLTHGGIYYGMRCAEILADCILKDRLAEYERRWKELFIKEINIGLKIREVYNRLSEENLEKVFHILKKNTHIIEEFGDFENHSRVISKIIQNPSLQILLGKVLISIINNNLF